MLQEVNGGEGALNTLKKFWVLILQDIMSKDMTCFRVWQCEA